jgi:hypothetical protein
MRLPEEFSVMRIRIFVLAALLAFVAWEIIGVRPAICAILKNQEAPDIRNYKSHRWQA